MTVTYFIEYGVVHRRVTCDEREERLYYERQCHPLEEQNIM